MPLDPADAGRLRDMIDYGQEAVILLGSMTAEQMVADRRTFLAVSRCVEVVAASTPPSFTRRSQGVHQVISAHLPPLVAQRKNILGE